MRTYQPLSSCVSMHGFLCELLFELCDTLHVVIESAPIRTLGFMRLQLPYHVMTSMVLRGFACILFDFSLFVQLKGIATFHPHLFLFFAICRSIN